MLDMDAARCIHFYYTGQHDQASIFTYAMVIQCMSIQPPDVLAAGVGSDAQAGLNGAVCDMFVFDCNFGQGGASWCPCEIVCHLLDADTHYRLLGVCWWTGCSSICTVCSETAHATAACFVNIIRDDCLALARRSDPGPGSPQGGNSNSNGAKWGQYAALQGALPPAGTMPSNCKCPGRPSLRGGGTTLTNTGGQPAAPPPQQGGNFIQGAGPLQSSAGGVGRRLQNISITSTGELTSVAAFALAEYFPENLPPCCTYSLRQCSIWSSLLSDLPLR